MGLTQKLGTIPLAIQTDSSNNVGIGGAANASYKLAVTGASLFTGAATFSSSVTANGVMSLGDDGTYGATYKTLGLTGNTDGTHRILAGTSDDMYIAAATSRGIKFCVNGSITTRAIITSTGNVGIGTSSPSTLLQTNQTGTTGYFYSGQQSGTEIAYWYYNASEIQFSSKASTRALTFLTTDTERMRITSGGNIAIGTGTTSRRLNVGSTTTPGFFHNTSNVSGSYCNIWQLGGSETNATSSYYLFCDTDNVGVRMVIAGNGNLANVNNSYGAYSDIKLKENIVDATPKLDDLMKVKIRNYNLIGEQTKQIGVIAQELEEIFPGLIEESNDTIKDENGENIETGETTKSVKYSVFVPMLIKAIQEQQEIINNLSAKVTALENR